MAKKRKWSKVGLAVLTLATVGMLVVNVVNRVSAQSEAEVASTNVAAETAAVEQAPAATEGHSIFDNAAFPALLALAAAIAAILYVILVARHVVKKDEGSDKVKKISAAIRTGAMAYLKQQYKIVGIFFVVMFLILFAIAFASKGKLLSYFVPFAFLTGGFFSGLAGFIGMNIATRANSRTAWAAKDGLNSGLRVAFMAGSVMGMCVVGLGLLDLSLWFLGLTYWAKMPIDVVTQTMLTFEMGASSMALFARVGGGIYTKSADVGADIVGKVEAGIPEDDPRNPATIADNVGDNVGDVAGMGADLYESYVGSIVATMALGAAAFAAPIEPVSPLRAVAVPMALAALGVVASLIGNFLVRTKDDNASQKTLLAALRKGVYGSSILVVIFAAVLIPLLLGMENFGIFIAILIGIVAGNIIGFFTEYFTSDHYKPTKDLAGQSVTGPATLIIGGLASGMMSTWIPVITVVFATVGAFFFSGGAVNATKGLYGIGIAAIGMLATLGTTLSTDAYGPVADNAGGIAEMAGTEGGLGKEVRIRTDALDSLGNTTAATGKGFAIGSAALTALALLAAFKEEIVHKFNEIYQSASQVNLNADVITPEVIVGLFIGAMAPFLFSALTMSAVGRAAKSMVEEVRRQFREIKGLLEGKAEPDYQQCVAISTKGAQREMIVPSLIAIVLPLVTGFLFGVKSLIGLLAGGLVTGFPLAIMMANSGGSWDNAKKYIESGNLGGKGSENHKAAVVGDTVGDPFKDTSGPSLNILIKLMSMVSVVFGATIIAVNKVIGIFRF